MSVDSSRPRDKTTPPLRLCTNATDLIHRLESDKTLALHPEALDAAVDIREQDPSGFALLKNALQKLKVPLRIWNEELKKRLVQRKQVWLDAKRAKKPDRLMDSDGRITIEVDTDEPRVVTETLSALAGRDDLYQRGGQLVHIVHDASRLAGIIRAKGSPRIVEVTLPGLRERCAAAARYYRWTLDPDSGQWEPEDLHPPDWCVREVEARGQWPGVRPLDGVVECPVLRPDGSVLDVPGYDRKTGLLYIPSGRFDKFSQPSTQEEASKAAAHLLDVVSDFPFATPADRSAWLASVLTPLARYAFKGPSPLFLFDANTRGAGKSKLSDIVSEIVFGRPMPRMAPSTDDADERKRITTLVMSGASAVLIDNVSGMLGTPSLDAALTGTEWRDRALGSNTEILLPLFIVWYATGNNTQLTGDTSRRCLRSRLESPEERPEEREGFKHPDVLEYVRKNRERLVIDALTILRAYCEFGKFSRPKIKPWGSFEGWSALIREAIAWVGLADPGDTREELRAEADTAANALADLITGWEEVAFQFGGQCAVAQILRALANNDAASAGPYATENRRYETLRSALSELCQTPPGKLPSARQLGNTLKKYRGRVVGGKALTMPKEHSKLGAVWTVRTVQRAVRGDSGDSGESPISNAGKPKRINSCETGKVEVDYLDVAARESPHSPESPGVRAHSEVGKESANPPPRAARPGQAAHDSTADEPPRPARCLRGHWPPDPACGYCDPSWFDEDGNVRDVS
jgi:hypothetical protein